MANSWKVNEPSPTSSSYLDAGLLEPGSGLRKVLKSHQYVYHFKCVSCGNPFSFYPAQPELVVCSSCGMSGVVTTGIEGGFVVVYFSDSPIPYPEAIGGTVTRTKGETITIDASLPPGKQTWCHNLTPSAGPYKSLNGPPVVISKQPLYLRYGNRLSKYGRYTTIDSCCGVASVVNTNGYLMLGYLGGDVTGFVAVNGDGVKESFRLKSAPAGVLSIASHYSEVLSEQNAEYDSEPDEPPEDNEPWESDGQEPDPDITF